MSTATETDSRQSRTSGLLLTPNGNNNQQQLSVAFPLKNRYQQGYQQEDFDNTIIVTSASSTNFSSRDIESINARNGNLTTKITSNEAEFSLSRKSSNTSTESNIEISPQVCMMKK
jgi:hypothetical protein